MRIKVNSATKRQSKAFINTKTGTIFKRNIVGHYFCSSSTEVATARELIRRGLQELFEGDSVTLEF